ncbi:PQQ-dependent dehydrogenase, methanol/ethanol family [Sphingobium indicum]|uniref:PQQ-dependent dehydrogenase, methanol/ethanol family n=2 Tax=Sphingobium indicum TaxID=332055 RepID=A0A4Q4J7G5_9SPHN|nr:PQQ-dependent dehydrogenase, methanol/ethanol family [Sphingobium indicum]
MKENGMRHFRKAALMSLALAMVAATTQQCSAPRPAEPYLDGSDGKDWPGYGRSFGEQHYSPLTQIDGKTVGDLGLAWWFDLGPENSATQPIAVDGVLYFGVGHSIVHAIDAKTGKLLWRHDPHAAEAAGPNLRLGWGSRGIAWGNGKIYTGTQDGRLIAIDARTGKEVWSVQTFDKDQPTYISGAPRYYAGKVIVGFGGDMGKVRGYVTTYDADTGKQLWRFYTVPGNPADGFENKAMEMAAGTWSGEWWKYGGGGTVWNAISYDPETDSIFLGTGNGYPWNHKVRSGGKGDNLFLASVVAVSGSTGEYKWHYQQNPGETWDYNAAMDMALADLTIAGKPRKVLVTAPKNGIFYVIDRVTGKLISAEPYTKVNWASKIDLATGRPVENPDARYPDGKTFTIWPSSAGGHSWQPMAYSPATRLAYIPVINAGMTIRDEPDLAHYKPPLDRSSGGSFIPDFDVKDPKQATGALVAWDPVTQKKKWSVEHPTLANGGVMATAGGLVFQGTVDGSFKAYDAATGKTVWSFAAGTPIVAPPISYRVGDTQYVTIITGLGTGLAMWAPILSRYNIDPRSQKRRVLTFAIGARAKLPADKHSVQPIAADPEFAPNPASAAAGAVIYMKHCVVCHGFGAVSGSHAPDLRRSTIPTSPEAFASVLREGALVSGGMPRFEEFTDRQREDVRQYIRTEMQKGRAGTR